MLFSDSHLSHRGLLPPLMTFEREDGDAQWSNPPDGRMVSKFSNLGFGGGLFFLLPLGTKLEGVFFFGGLTFSSLIRIVCLIRQPSACG